MKHELKISRLAVVCVLCAAVSGAYGASSVRSLGGSGTYTSAAAAAADGNSGGAASVRGGSLRVTPSSGVSGTTTNISAGNTTGGRVATSPRLSIGHYLGGGTSVSGGSSIRPITPGGSTSGGGSSSGGSGGVSSDDLDALRGQVDQLERDIEGLRTADDNFSDALLDKQDALIPGDDGYIIIDESTNEIFVDVDALEGALETVAGKDGREVELGSNDTHLLWRYVGESGWRDLIAIADITGPQGPQGEKGEKGEPGEAANLEAYSTTEEMNQAIRAAVDGLAGTYATKPELTNVSSAVDALSGKIGNTAMGTTANTVTGAIAELAGNADNYENVKYKATVAMWENNKNSDTMYPTAAAVSQAIADATSDIVGSEEIEQFKDDVAGLKAAVGDENSGLVKDVDDLSGAVTALDGEMDTVSQLAGSAASAATGAAESAAQALAGLADKEDKSNKKTTLTNSDTDYPSTSAVTTALADKANVDDIPTTVAELTDASNYVTTTGLDSAIDSAIAEKDFVTNADLAGKADASDVEALGQRVTAAETDIGEINATMGSGELTTSDKTVLGAINELKSKTDGMATDGNFEEMNEKITAMESKLSGKQDVDNLVQVVSEADTTKYPSGAAVYKELETKANASELDTLEQTVGQLDSTINAEGTGLADRVDAANTAASAAQTAAEEAAQTAESVQDSLALKQDVSAREATTITNDETKYPSSAAVTAALAGKADVSALDDYVTNDGLGDALATAGAVTDANMSEKLADYATKSDLSGYATTDALNAKADKATTLAGYGITDTYTSAEIDDKLEAVTVGGMEGMEEILAGKQDKNIPGATNHVVVTDASGNITTTATIGIDKVTDLQTSLDAKADAATVDGLTESVGDLQTTVKGEDGTGGLVQQISELTTNVTNVTQNVTNITEQVSEITNPDTGVQSQITKITNIIGNDESGLVADVADAKAAAEKASQDVAGKQDALTAEQLNAVNSGITAEKVSVYDGYADTIAGKQDALGYTAENEANKTDDMTVDAGSTTKYPTVHAVEAYVTNTVAEGVDINTDQIDDGAVTKPKLHQDLQDEIEGKEDKANLKALAYKEQIKDADVADDAAISKSKLALDVQSALDNAANAVSMAGASENSVLGTDGEGNPVWYEIAM